MSSLFDYEDVAPPKVKEVKPLTVDGYVIGFVGPSNRGRAIVTQQERHMQADGKQDYFRKLGGYSFEPSMLDEMDRFGVTRIIIEEVDNEQVLEFDVAQYRNGIPTATYNGEPKLCVPESDALHTWRRAACSFYDASGFERGVTR